MDDEVICFHCSRPIWWGDQKQQWLLKVWFGGKPASYCSRNLGKWYHEPAMDEDAK